MIKVITYGTYDLLHYGHIRLLERAKALGDYLIVGVTSDDYDKSRGKINNQQSLLERIAAVRATGIADEIIIEEYEGQKIDDIRRYGVDIFTVGSDWKGQFDYLNEFCKVVYLDRTVGISSSDIRSKKSKHSIEVVGTLPLCKKFINESKYVNGVEIVENDGDSVYLVSTPDKHYEQIKAYLNAGKHVVCESPIALKESECAELFDIARKKKCVLMDGIKTAYSTAYYRLLLLIKSGKIGNVLSVDATCTSIRNYDDENSDGAKWNSISLWGPTALLPIFQILGTEYKSSRIISNFANEKTKYDGFTKIDLVYDNAVASVKVAQQAKSEGDLVITGTKGYVYVPAPWWKTDYFEVRYENIEENKRYFYQLDGEGIRYEIVSFSRAIDSDKNTSYISESVSVAIAKIMEQFYSGDVILIK